MGVPIAVATISLLVAALVAFNVISMLRTSELVVTDLANPTAPR